MSVFTKRNFQEKLVKDLANDVSKGKEIRMWILEHKIHFQAIVRIWFKELIKASPVEKLAFLYLAYDVMWHSTKDCPEFVTEFGKYMKNVFEHLVTVDFDDRAMCVLGELVQKWRTCRIFDQDIQDKVEKIWGKFSDGVLVAKQVKKELSLISNCPPHLKCSVCSGLLKEPVQLPCCKTALCKFCAYEKLERYKGCWFGFCPKSVLIRKEEVRNSPELTLQVENWKSENIMYLEVENKDGFPVNASNAREYFETDIKCEKQYQRKSCETMFGDKAENDELKDLKWDNPAGENEKYSMDGTGSPVRESRKRCVQFDDKRSKKTSKISTDDGNNGLRPTLTQLVNICGSGTEKIIKVATESDGTLLLSSVRAHFPGTVGLKDWNPQLGDGFSFNFRHRDGVLYPPAIGGWRGKVFVCIKPAGIIQNQEIARNENLSHVDGDQTNSLVVYGLPRNAEEEDIKKYFEQYGKVLGVQLQKGTKCSAILRFAKKDVELAVVWKTYLIGIRWCYVGYLETHGKDTVDEDDNSYSEIFVDHVAETLTSEDLRKYFETFGQVRDVYFSEPRKNFAFVRFSNQKVAMHRQVAMSLRGSEHRIKDANVRVGYCVSYGIDARKAKLHVQAERSKQAARKAKEEAMSKAKRDVDLCRKVRTNLVYPFVAE